MQTIKTKNAAIDADGKIRGADTEALRIAALVEGGMRLDEILRDYPGLTGAQIAEAVAYRKANPEHGRAYPDRTVKSVLRRGRGGLAEAFAAANEDLLDRDVRFR